ncbi:MAG: esterase-like activity of phytase family protein [Bauldia sp.]
MRSAFAGPLCAGMVMAFVAGVCRAAEPGFAPVEMRATPISAFRIGETGDRFGALEFRGGLALWSRDRRFGSWSGLDFGADGQTLYAVSDKGFWFSARVIEEAGHLVGIADAKLAPMLDERGQALADKDQSDAEGLRIAWRDGVETALVSFEQVTEVRTYAAAPDFALARSGHVALPFFARRLHDNQGLEAIAVAPAESRLGGAVVVIAEHSLNADRNHRAFVLDGPLVGAFAIRRVGDFDLTDAAFLADGDLLVLERRFSLSNGVGMRIRRIPGGVVAPGATVDGVVLIEADLGYQIDNMEGLSVRVTGEGETTIDLISDDNQNPLQRTLLLQFVLPSEPPPPRPGAAVGRPPR